MDAGGVRRRAARVTRAGAEATAVAVLAAGTGLLIWSLLPVAVGWTPHVVVSGSMEPRLRAGDVVVSSPVDADEVVPGQVVLARAAWAEDQVVTHRVVQVLDDGSLVTRGDANQDQDPEPVDPAADLGLARLRVPWAGLPLLWVGQGRWGATLLVVGLVAGLTLLARAGLGAGRPGPGPRQRVASAAAKDGTSGSEGSSAAW